MCDNRYTVVMKCVMKDIQRYSNVCHKIHNKRYKIN